MNIVARRREGVYPSLGHHLVVSFSYPEGRLRGVIRGCTDNFKVSQPQFTFVSQSANTRVWMIVWRQDNTRFNTPLDNEERRTAETGGKEHTRIDCGVRVESRVRNFLEPFAERADAVEVFINTESRVGNQLLSYRDRHFKKVFP